MSREYEVEAIIGRRVIRGKEKYRVKWTGYPEEEATWEPVESLQSCLELIIEFNENTAQRERQNEIIDWEAAKNFSVEVMEFFGSRLVWKSLDEMLDPETVDDNTGTNENDQPSTSNSSTRQPTITPPPNEIEYDD
ncbi:chromobox protein homolog hpl-1-like [Sitodiplosis mosellana]|uniref:chromobox protein homolog hpl-1-like n=1 Tax=Sitodiplosis mosellana TaxID=263140 RepID=UPI00244379A0|nr:chromobox protein homolog hpl-1-like [Sitodiplosis mosellana]